MASLGHAALAKRLHGAALSYHALGYSVIPILGDDQLNAPKSPAIPWKPFQQKRAHPEQIDHWFLRREYQGLAIVTGAVSRLAVLDFDDPRLAKRFESHYPELARTRIILSAGRQLPHYYFEIPPGVRLQSTHLPGVDLQYDGCYVLTAPTSIDGKEYKIHRGGQPKRLTIAEIQALQAFLEDVRLMTQESPKTPQITQSESKPLTVEELPAEPQHFSAADAITLYKQHAKTHGRNNALFHMACQLRDALWTEDAVIAVLAQPHITQPANDQHTPETPQQRRAEALATIASAFKRAPRKPRKNQPHKSLPNSLREHLLQQGKIALARVLDGLLIAGVKEGQLLDEKFMRETLKDQIGRHSIRKALSEIDPEGQPVFQKNPSPRPPTPTAVAAATAEDSNNPCELFRVTRSDKNRGRPTTYYAMPRIDAICARYGVERTAGDELQREDLWSVRKYRQALHRELIKRRPGQYSGEWLAARIGLSKRSIQRYRQDLPLKQRPQYHTTWITWETLEKLPHEADIQGTFLQDEMGKRYPATQAIARKLLAKGQGIAYQRQTANYYWHQETVIDPKLAFPDAPQSPKLPPKRHFKPLPVQRVETSISTLEIAPESDLKLVQAEGNNSPSQIQEMEPTAQPTENPYQPRAKRYYRQPLADAKQEQGAMRLYKKVLSKNCEGKTRLSKSMSRRLVEQYGMQEINRLIQILTWRDNIENPAGFSVIYLRSQSKIGNSYSVVLK